MPSRSGTERMNGGRRKAEGTGKTDSALTATMKKTLGVVNMERHEGTCERSGALTIKEAAMRLRVGIGKVRRLMQTGEIRGYKQKGRIRKISEDSLRKYEKETAWRKLNF